MSRPDREKKLDREYPWLFDPTPVHASLACPFRRLPGAQEDKPGKNSL